MADLASFLPLVHVLCVGTPDPHPTFGLAGLRAAWVLGPGPTSSFRHRGGESAWSVWGL